MSSEFCHFETIFKISQGHCGPLTPFLQFRHLSSSNLAKFTESLFQLYFRRSCKPHFSSPISSIFSAGSHVVQNWRPTGRRTCWRRPSQSRTSVRWALQRSSCAAPAPHASVWCLNATMPQVTVGGKFSDDRLKRGGRRRAQFARALPAVEGLGRGGVAGHCFFLGKDEISGLFVGCWLLFSDPHPIRVQK